MAVSRIGVIGIGNMVWLLTLGASVALGSVTLPAAEEEPESAPSCEPEAEDFLKP